MLHSTGAFILVSFFFLYRRGARGCREIKAMHYGNKCEVLWEQTCRALQHTIRPNLDLVKSNLNFIKYKLDSMESNLETILCYRLREAYALG